MKLDFGQVRAALESFPRHTVEKAGLRPAAVLLCICRREEGDRILLTRRTDLVEHHRGEISFPGGAREPADRDLLETALRETEEEIGLDKNRVNVLGRLDDFVSVHGYHVSPFVGAFPGPETFRIDRNEIAELLEMPVSVFLDPEVFRVEDWTWQGRREPVFFFSVGNHEVWGLTAAILRQFFERTGFLPPVAS